MSEKVVECVDPKIFHEMTMAILARANFSFDGAESLAEKYYHAYVNVMNKLYDKHAQYVESKLK